MAWWSIQQFQNKAPFIHSPTACSRHGGVWSVHFTSFGYFLQNNNSYKTPDLCKSVRQVTWSIHNRKISGSHNAHFNLSWHFKIGRPSPTRICQMKLTVVFTFRRAQHPGSTQMFPGRYSFCRAPITSVKIIAASSPQNLARWRFL